MFSNPCSHTDKSNMTAPNIDDPEQPVRGLLLIVDLLPEEDGWNVIKEKIKNVSFFFESELRYQVEHKDINDDLKNIIPTEDDKQIHSVILLLLDCLGEQNITKEKKRLQVLKRLKLGEYWKQFCVSDNFKEINKIWIQHICKVLSKAQARSDAADEPESNPENTHKVLSQMEAQSDDADEPESNPENTHEVLSKMEGYMDEIKKTKSLFFEALRYVLEKGAHIYKIVEIFEEIQKYVELKQYKQYQEETNTGVYQQVDFKVPNEGSFKFASEPLADPETSEPLADPEPGLFGDVPSILQYEVQEYLQSDPKYKLTKNPRGFCIICNISWDRPGSRVDEARMENLFKQLMFDIRLIRNKTHSVIEAELKDIMDQITEQQHQSLVLLLMAHGRKDENNNHQFRDIGSKKQSSKYIFDIIGNCAGLVGCPKIFFIQTCMGVGTQGNENPNGADSDESDEIYFEWSDSQSSSNTIGNGTKAASKMSDIIIYHATVKGNKSYRDPIEGSRMIKCIDKIFRKHCWQKNICSLLNDVTKEVSKKPKHQKKWQQPVMKDFSTMSGDLHLNPGFQEDAIRNYYCNDAEWSDTPGNTAWFTVDKKSVIVFDMWNPLLLSVLEFQGPNEPNSIENEDEEMSIILSGVALDKYTHLVLVYKDSGQKLSILKTCITDNDNGYWYFEDTEIESQGVLAICEVNQDAVGLLVSGIYGLEIHIHSRNCNFPEIQKNIPLKKTTAQKTDSSKYILQFSKETFLVLSGETVRVFNLKGDNIKEIRGRKVLRFDSPEAGDFFMPCAVTKDKDKNILVACYNAIHIYKKDGWEILRNLSRVNYFCCDKSMNVKIMEIGGPMIASRIPVIEQNAKLLHNSALNNEYGSIWPTQDPNIFALGHYHQNVEDGEGKISLFNSENRIENMVRLNLPNNQDIRDGLWLGGTRHLVITGEAYIVEIDTDKRTCSDPQKLDIPTKAAAKKCISISEFEFAVLCQFPQTEKRMTGKIHTFSKTHLQLIKTVTVKFNYPVDEKSDFGIFSVSAENGWLIGPVKTNKIFKFSTDGILGERISLDKIHSLVDVSLDEDGGMVLTTADGKIFRHHDSKWSSVIDLTSDTRALCYRYNKIYKLDRSGTNFDVYQLYK